MRNSSMIPMVLAAAVVLLAAGGCTSARRYGDAKLVRVADVQSVTVVLNLEREHLVLPRFDITRRGTHTFRVRDLPFGAYPMNVQLDIEPDLDRSPDANVPRNIAIEVNLRTTGGEPIHQHTAVFDVAGGQKSERLPIPADVSATALRSYDVIVSVIVPYELPGNQAHLETYLGDWEGDVFRPSAVAAVNRTELEQSRTLTAGVLGRDQ